MVSLHTVVMVAVHTLKKAWLDDAGIDVSKVDGVTMDFNTYYGILKQLAAKKGHYVISALTSFQQKLLTQTTFQNSISRLTTHSTKILQESM